MGNSKLIGRYRRTAVCRQCGTEVQIRARLDMSTQQVVCETSCTQGHVENCAWPIGQPPIPESLPYVYKVINEL